MRERPVGRMNGLIMVGVILVVAGVLGFAIPVFTTQQTKEVARIGDLKLQNTEDTSHRIPPILSGGALVLGIILIGASLYQKR
jgi:ABC-type nickel/cobalt efflux system permease component RcnA